MAALITKETGADVELVEGGRGEFSVVVDDNVIARKDSNGFPSEEDALAAVRRALSAR